MVLPGLTGDNADPSGRDRRTQIRPFRPLADRFTVCVVNRRPGLAPGTTLRDLAEFYAVAIDREFGEPVHLVGVSTGGSIAQLLAVDHARLVRHLVLVCSACRLSGYGRHVQRTLARRTIAGQSRRAWAATGPALAATAVGGWLMSAFVGLFSGGMIPTDPTDLLITIEAEDSFDSSSDLGRITAPTLVIGGARDRYYAPELFRETAEGIRGARLHLYPRAGHFGVLAHPGLADEIGQFLTVERGAAR